MRSIAENTATNILKEQFIPDHVFIYVVKGALRIFDGDTNYIFKSGDAFLARKNRLAKYELLENKDPFEPILFCFDEAFLKEFKEKHTYKKSGFKTNKALINIKKSAFITSFIKSVKPYYKDIMELDADFEDLKYEELLIILLKQQPELVDLLFDFAPQQKINLEAYMNKNYTFNVNLERFAILTGRSLSAFKRDFQSIFNETPNRWLVKKRLEEAHLLISQKKQKPIDIYLDLGFESLSHFSVAFKKLFGITPTKLR
ncbi:helix-turn-helix domain-containing protein [Pedobacter miscanthi]|uniref:AraC family transcriptional regulator n=1 Tax=Pedobacter miscanthi TaxID=2259170 RepID=A0A366KSU2_9SPHI|nr:AraC family transcriptional regulator [Pedobacter miscanthi]RBQ04279.1 AraC family transcriptional regulator [Pedobacter miscanthi]